MDISLVVELLALALLLAASAFFSSSETSLFSLSAAQMQQMRRDRNPRLALIEDLLSEPRRLIATILIGNEMVNVCASVLSATIVIGLFGAGNSWLNIVIMVPLLLLFGEITPKTLALGNNVAFATFQSRYIDLFARAISPVRRVVRAVSEFFINLLVSGERSRSNILTEDMVRSLARAAVGEGSLDSKESAYIHQIFDFGNKTVGDVMTLRSRMVSVDLSMSLAEIVALQKKTRRSKLPVFDADGESVMGVLFARDLLDLKADAEADDPQALRSILRAPYLVPKSRMAADLFLKLRERHTSLALVTDEFGGIVGLVSLEDLLECIFGELPSSSDRAGIDSPSLDVLGPGLYRASGNTPLRRFNEVAGTAFEAPGVTTLAGLVLHVCGELPALHDVVTIDNGTFTVTAVTPQRILALTIQVRERRQPPPEAARADDGQPTDRGDDPHAGNSGDAGEARPVGSGAKPDLNKRRTGD